MTALTVLEPGPLACVQDGGRAGYAEWGVSPSGAVDVHSHGLGNRMVGNPETAGAIEILMGGFAASVDDDRWCSVAGAPAPVTVDGLAVPNPLLFHVRRGSVVRLGQPVIGLRSYLALAGGVGGRSALGSYSWDSLGRLGTPPAETGTRWAVGAPFDRPRYTEVLDLFYAPADITVDFRWGPRHALLDPASRDALLTTTWQVGSETDRVGARLVGGRVALTEGSLPSEGCVAGSLQIPPNGHPIIFLADHPVTGGYPVVGVADSASRSRIAQARPGTALRLRARS